jgi:hypothetical protein
MDSNMWQAIKRVWTKPATSKPIRRRRPTARLQVEGLEQRALAAGLVLPMEPVSQTVDPSGNTYYVGSANGGVWKTTPGPGVGFLRSMDGGRTW